MRCAIRYQPINLTVKEKRPTQTNNICHPLASWVHVLFGKKVNGVL